MKTDSVRHRSLPPRPMDHSPTARRAKGAPMDSRRLRAALLPRAQAYREAGWNDSSNEGAYSHACRLETRPGVKARIKHLAHQAEDLIAEKRQRIEAALWDIHEADLGECFETVEVVKRDKDGKLETDEAGKMLTVRKQRPKLLADLPPELRKAIEDVTVDRHGNFVPKLYSKAQARALQAAQSRCARAPLGQRRFTTFRCRAAPAVG